MRILVVGLLVMASAIVAQVQREPGPQWDKMQRRMLLLDKPIGRPTPDVTYTADSVNQTGSTVVLEGHVRISGKGFAITADRAEYRPESGQIDAKGAMHVQLR